jgi:hypothetical protein
MVPVVTDCHESIGLTHVGIPMIEGGSAYLVAHKNQFSTQGATLTPKIVFPWQVSIIAESGIILSLRKVSAVPEADIEAGSISSLTRGW